jgi:hypothetical protein
MPFLAPLQLVYTRIVTFDREALHRIDLHLIIFMLCLRYRW